VKLVGRLSGKGKLILEKRSLPTQYDIDIWQAESGLNTARGTISVTVEAGPCKLVLEDGHEVEVFVTTGGAQGGAILVNSPLPGYG
jgi:hypothetical protein